MLTARGSQIPIDLRRGHLIYFQHFKEPNVNCVLIDNKIVRVN